MPLPHIRLQSFSLRRSSSSRIALAVALFWSCTGAQAQLDPVGNAGDASVVAAPTGITGQAPVIAAGVVPDEATKSAVLTRLRALYGTGRVVDKIQVDSVLAPPNWREHVVDMLGPGLKDVSQGELSVNGSEVRISGTVANEAQRQQVASGLSVALNATYSVTNALKNAGVGQQQDLLDDALAGRIIEFESGSARLTGSGQGILDEMAAALQQVGDRHVQVTGHTDSVGGRDANVALSMQRAIAVKGYLEQHGVAPGNLSVQGLGPDQPVADNTTDEGRARNRRIEFRVL